MDKYEREARLKVLHERLAACYEHDSQKPVYTPQELAREMLSRLPVLSGEVLVVSDLGLLLEVWARTRQVEGVKITFVAHTPEQERFSQSLAVKTWQVGYNNAITQLEKRCMGLKFDIIVGNPPYQDSSNRAKNVKLWHRFSWLSLEHLTQDGWIAFITPSSIFKPIGEGGKLLAHINGELKLEAAELHTEKKFDAGVETCHWIASRVARGIQPPDMRSEGQTILDKIDGSGDPRLPLIMQNGWVRREHLVDDDDAPVIFFSGDTKSHTREKLDGVGTLKIVFPFSASYHKQFVTRSAVGMLNLCLPVKNEEEAQNILSYTMSKALRFFAQRFKKTSGFTPAVKAGRLPMLDPTRPWTDVEVYEHFGLTPDEIDLVERSVK